MGIYDYDLLNAAFALAWRGSDDVMARRVLEIAPSPLQQRMLALVPREQWSRLGLAASTLLFFAFFRLLAQPNTPSRSLWSGSFLGAVVFEVLKQLSTFLLKATANSEAFQAFGIALILMVWINYTSRVVVLSAAWAHTSPEARSIRDANRVADQMPEGPRIDLAAAAPGVRTASAASSPKAAFAAGAASMLGLVALLRRRS